MSKIIIHVSGGLVQGVSTDSKEDFDVEVWDEDIMEDGGWIDEMEALEAEENDERLSALYATLRTIY